MIIRGLNKLTLLDFPSKTACTVFTGGCNFRCPFCQNASLVLDAKSQPEIPLKEFFDFLKSRKNLLEGVCITGGEPTLETDLADFMGQIKALGYMVKLDTNGNNFEVLKNLIDNKLVDYVAMDVKNSLEKYGKTIGIENFNTSTIEKSVELIKNSDVEYEFRTTVAVELQDENDIREICNLIKGAKRFYLQSYRLSDDMVGEEMTPPKKATLQKFKEIASEYVDFVDIRGV